MNQDRIERPSPVKGGGLFAFAAAAVLFTLYSASLGHNFLFDEENIILRNPLIRSFALVPELFRHGYFYFEGRAADWQQYYRPLTSLTFTLDHFFWKFDPFGYNLTNLILHLAVSVLVFYLLRFVLGAPRPAFFAALLWSAHTIHTEAVTYTASRGDLLGGLFLLAVLLFYAKGRRRSSLAVFALALFSKESLLLGPLYLAALEVCFVRSGLKRAVVRLAPFFAVAALFFIFRKFYSPVPLGPPSDVAPGPVLRVLSMGPALTEYLMAVVLPEAFKFCKEVPFATRVASWQVFQTLLAAAALGAAWWLAFRRRGAACFGLSVFLVGLAPYSQLIHFYPEWAEHYLYIPSMGLAVLLGSFMTQISRKASARAAIAAGLLYAVFFGFVCLRTWQRNAYYKDTKGYYAKLAASDSPYAYYGYQNLARLAIEEGRWKEALVPLKTAFAIEPASDVTNNLLGLVFLNENRFAEAAEHFRRAYRLSGDVKYLANAGTALIRAQAYGEAAELFEAMRKIAPRQLSVYTNLIGASELAGEPKKARQWGREGLRAFEGRDRETVVLLMALARLAYRQGWADELHENLELILTRQADAFWYADLARLWLGRLDAEVFLQKAGRDYPGFEAAAKLNVMIAYAILGKSDSAALFYASHRQVLDEQAASHPLIARELQKAARLTEPASV